MCFNSLKVGPKLAVVQQNPILTPTKAVDQSKQAIIAMNAEL